MARPVKRDPAKDDRGRNPDYAASRTDQQTTKIASGEAVVETAEANDRKSYWQKPNNWIRLGTLLAVLTYTGFQVWQTVLIRQNNVVSQRAFVSIAPTAGFPALDDKDQTRKVIGFLVPFINSGNTPTRDARLLVRCAPSIEALADPWVVIHNDKLEQRPTVISGHSATTVACTFTADQMLQAKRNTLHTYVMAEITYRDRLEPAILHRTQAEWELIHPLIDDALTEWNGAQWSGVGYHNCADEECPVD